MENGLAGADVDILTEATNLAQASCAVLREVSLRLLPVPSRPHYRYTVRDMARVFQSVLGASSPCRASPRRLATLWYHEVLRVLYDRLLDADLQKWFMAMLAGVISSHDISLDTKRLGDVDGQEVLFCNFIRQRGEEYTAVIPFSDGYEEEGTGLAPREATEVQPTADEPEETLPLKEESRAGGRPRPKETSARKRRKRVTSTRKLEQTEVAEEGGEVKKAGAGGDKEAPSPAEASLFHSPEMTREEVMQRSAELRRKLLSAEDGSHTGPLLAELIDCYQIEYCYANPKQPLSLIMFRAATSHVARVARAVSQARNNLLLLGSAASAVRTVARFAAFLADLQAVEVTMQPGETLLPVSSSYPPPSLLCPLCDI